MKKLIILSLIVILLISGIPYFAENTKTEPDLTDATIALHIGSPLVLNNKDIKALDSENPNVVPVIYKDRTLIPLRAISEHFGAEVSYDSINREAKIKYNGATYVFPIGENHYRVEKLGLSTKTVEFDTESLIIQDRTMVPLRVISEDILGHSVEYEDKVITIGSKIVLDDTKVNEIKTKIGQAIKVTSLDELNGIIKNMANFDGPIRGMADESTNDLSVEAEAPAGETEYSGGSSDDFSKTNEQVEGINEADIVKTDGRFIYVATGKSVKIYKANDGKPILTDEIEFAVDKNTGEYVQFTEMYIDEGRLVVLGSKNNFDNWIRPIDEPVIDPTISIDIGILPMGKNYTYTGVYEVDANGKLGLLKEFEVEGSLLSSRKKDDTVYLVVNQYMNFYYGLDDTFIPSYRDSVIGEEYRHLSVDNIMYYPGRYNPNYLIIAALDIRDSNTETTIEAFLGSGSVVYMSNNALYIAAQDYNSILGTITNISKFTIDGMKIGFAGGGMVEGYILNQFAMDEFEGNLRVATTNWKRESINALYILDKNLNEIGAVDNLAPGETIYSTRFMGDKGYIVTFRQIDPLFVLDLSNPNSPKVVGELKIPGFSNYLHPIGEDLLLGIGQDVDEKTGQQEGIKLSIFDVSDGGKPKEINNVVFGGSGSYAEVLYNHKALMLNLKDNMIGFTARLTEITDALRKDSFNGALLLEVKENGEINTLKKISNDGLYASYVDRIIYIGDILYYIQDDTIRTFNLND